MVDQRPSDADLALFVDLYDAAHESGLQPILIGAGAIQLSDAGHWSARLERRTRDWDFAVRVASWEEYELLRGRLVRNPARFVQVEVRHRFHHREGGQLDVIPFGGVEEPPGKLIWPSGETMDVTGLDTLPLHTSRPLVERPNLLVATIPAVIGLKLLAYVDRRTSWVIRDVQDVHSILQQAGRSDHLDHRIVTDDRALRRLEDGDVDLGQMGPYFLGRDVASAFGARAVGRILDLLSEGPQESGRLVPDVLRGEGQRFVARDLVIARFGAFELGVVDGQARAQEERGEHTVG